MIIDVDYEKYISGELLGKSFNIGTEHHGIDRIIKVLSYSEAIIEYYKNEPRMRGNFIVKFAETECNGILAIRYHMENPGAIYYINDKLNIFMMRADYPEFLTDGFK